PLLVARVEHKHEMLRCQILGLGRRLMKCADHPNIISNNGVARINPNEKLAGCRGAVEMTNVLVAVHSSLAASASCPRSSATSGYGSDASACAAPWPRSGGCALSLR